MRNHILNVGRVPEFYKIMEQGVLLLAQRQLALLYWKFKPRCEHFYIQFFLAKED